MYRGRLVEVGPPDAIFSTPAHPYTRALLSALPSLAPGERLERVPFDAARIERRPLREIAPGHLAAI
jgi:oligopeptide/dipeptide ABC transporter ATP-binding protein